MEQLDRTIFTVIEELKTAALNRVVKLNHSHTGEEGAQQVEQVGF